MEPAAENACRNMFFVNAYRCNAAACGCFCGAAAMPSPLGKVPQCAHWGGRGKKCASVAYIVNIRRFAPLIRHGSRRARVINGPLPPCRVMSISIFSIPFPPAFVKSPGKIPRSRPLWRNTPERAARGKSRPGAFVHCAEFWKFLIDRIGQVRYNISCLIG